MKIKYEFVDGDVELEVSDEWASVLAELDRLERNNDKKEKRRHYSLEACTYEGEDFIDETTPENIFEQKCEDINISHILEKMSDVQQRRLMMFIEGKSYREIGRIEGVSHIAVRKSIEAAKKIFFNNFEK